MVRETRHLWVGNLPESATEDRLRELFKRYGPVQSVKIGSSGEATVAFVDICSATKALKVDHRLDDRNLKTLYHEPSISVVANSHYPSSGSNSIHRNDNHYSSNTVPNSSIHGGRSPRFNLSDEHSSYERSSHFYENRREESVTYNGHGTSSSSGSSGLRRGYGGDRDSEYNNQSRGRVRSYPSRGPFQANGRPESGDYRWGGGQYRYHSDSYSSDKMRRTTTPGSSPPPNSRSVTRNPRVTALPAKRHPPASRSGSESPSSSRSSRSSSTSSSNSSSSHSSSSDSSVGQSSRSASRSPRRFNGPTGQPSNISPRSPVTEKRPLAICVKNLPPWSLDNSLKDGLFHDYKKHGTVTTVRMFGTSTERYAIVCFKRPDDAEKALIASRGKQFFGVTIEVTPHEGIELDESEYRSYDAEVDEYHQKATRTLFIGGLGHDITTSELRKHLEPFGDIIDIDIKHQSVSTFAFCQFSDIRSVVQAVKKMDGEYIGTNKIKLGFGKSMPNRSIWIGGIPEGYTETTLSDHFLRFGPITSRHLDREKGQALLSFENDKQAGAAVAEMRGVSMGGRRVQVDFASRECQISFYNNIDKSDRSWERRNTEKFERQRRDSSYTSRQVSTGGRIAYNPARTRRYDGYEDYNNGRNYDDFADDSFERDLHEYAGRQRFENGPTSASSANASQTPVTPRSFSPTKLREKSPFSPRPTPRSDSELQSPTIRPHDDVDIKKLRHRSPSSFEADSYLTHSPTLSSKLLSPNPKASSKRSGHASPTSVISSPSREVSVVDDKVIPDPRRRRAADFKSLVVKVNDPKKFSDLNFRLYGRKGQESERDRSGKLDVQDPRLGGKKELTPSSGDERPLETDRISKKLSSLPDRNSRILNHQDCKSRGLSPSFRKPFDSRKPSEQKIKRDKTKIPPESSRDKHSSSACDPRNRKSANQEEGAWSSKGTSMVESELSPPGTPVRDEMDDPTPSYSRYYPYHENNRHSAYSNLPLPRFAQSLKSRSSPRAPSLPMNTAPNSPSLGGCEKNYFFPELSGSALTDTPVSPGPVFQDISDTEDSLEEESLESLELFEKIKSLDVKFQQWSGSTRGSGPNAPPPSEDCRIPPKPKSDAVADVMKRIPSLQECAAMKPSSIVQSVLAKPSIFDEDIARLKVVEDKYIPKTYQGNSKQRSLENSPAQSPVISKLSPIPSATPLSSLPGIRVSCTPHLVSSPPPGMVSKICKTQATINSPLNSPACSVESEKAPFKSAPCEKLEDNPNSIDIIGSPLSERNPNRRSSTNSNSSIMDSRRSLVEETTPSSPLHLPDDLHSVTPTSSIQTPVKSFPRSSKNEPSGRQTPGKGSLAKAPDIVTPIQYIKDDKTNKTLQSSESPLKILPTTDKVCSRKRKHSSLDSEAEKSNEQSIKDETSNKLESEPKRIKVECEDEKENRNKSHKENHHIDRKSRSERKREDHSLPIHNSSTPVKQNPKETKCVKEEKIGVSIKEEKQEIDLGWKSPRVVTSCSSSNQDKETIKEEKNRNDIGRRRNSEETRRERTRKDKDQPKDKERHRNNSIPNDKNREKSSRDKEKVKHRSSSKSELNHSSSERTPEAKDNRSVRDEGIRSKKVSSKSSKSSHDSDEIASQQKNHSDSKLKESGDRFRNMHSNEKHRTSARKGSDKQEDADHAKNTSDLHRLLPKSKSPKGIRTHEDIKIDTEDISSDEDCLKIKTPQKPVKRTKERVNSSSSNSGRNLENTPNVDSEIESSEEDEPKKPSYFDIPVYFGDMYDNVKTRAVKMASKTDEGKKREFRTTKTSRTKKRSALQSDSDVSDMESQMNRKIICTSSEDDTTKVRLSPNSGDLNDSVFSSNTESRKSSNLKELKAQVSDISTDEEGAFNRVRLSGSRFGTGFISSRKASSDSERSEISSSHRRISSSSNPKSLEKSSRKESLDSIDEVDPEQTVKPRAHDKSSESTSKDRSGFAVTNSKLSSTQTHMNALFGVLSDDSDSNVTSTNESDFDSFRKNLVREASSIQKSPSHSTDNPRVFESDDESRHSILDVTLEKRCRSEQVDIEKDFDSDEKMLSKDEIILVENKDELIANISSSWKDSAKDTLSEISRSDSGKGSSCGVSTTSSSSSSEELMLLEAAAALNPECENEEYQSASKNPDIGLLKSDHVQRKDKKKKKHKDKGKRSSTKSHSSHSSYKNKSRSHTINSEIIKLDGADGEKLHTNIDPNSPEVVEKKSMALDMPFIEAEYSNESNLDSEIIAVETLAVPDTKEKGADKINPKEKSPARTSRSNISQEETQNAVAGLLACYNGYPDSPSSENLDDLPTEGAPENDYQSDEADAAVQILASEMPCEIEAGPSSENQSWDLVPHQSIQPPEDPKEIQIVSNSVEASSHKSNRKIAGTKMDKLSVPSDHFPDSPASVQSEPELQIDEAPEPLADSTDISPVVPASQTEELNRASKIAKYTTASTAPTRLLIELEENKATTETLPQEETVQNEPKTNNDTSENIPDVVDPSCEVKKEGIQTTFVCDILTSKVPVKMETSKAEEDPDESSSRNLLNNNVKMEGDAEDSKEMVDFPHDSSVGSSLDDSCEGPSEPIKQRGMRGRSKGRGKRGRGGRSDTIVDDTNTMVTRSSLTTRNRSRGLSGRGSRMQEIGTEEEGSVDAKFPEQPRRSTRTKRARKHPDMVDHDESTIRRKRNTRGARANYSDYGAKLTQMSSDVYDFHASDEESGSSPAKKSKKDSSPSQPVIIASNKEDETVDSMSQRKSPRLKEKVVEGEPASSVIVGQADSFAAITRSRGRNRGKEDSEDDSSVTRKKKILKAYEAEKKDAEAAASQSDATSTNSATRHSLMSKPLTSNIFVTSSVPSTNIMQEGPKTIYDYSSAPSVSKASVSLVIASQSPPTTTSPGTTLTNTTVHGTKQSVSYAGKGMHTAAPEAANKRPLLPHRNTLSTDKEHSPTPLVDPVTGHLTPMDIDDEGQYIPVSEDQAVKPSLVTCKVDNPAFSSSHTPNIRAVIPPNLTVTTVSISHADSAPAVSSSFTSVTTRPQNILSISRVGEVSVELVSKSKAPAPSVQKGVILTTKAGSHMPMVPLIIATPPSAHGSPANSIARTNHSVQISQIKSPIISPAQISISPKLPVSMSSKLSSGAVTSKSSVVLPVKSESHIASTHESGVQLEVTSKSISTSQPSAPDARSVITSTNSTLIVGDKSTRIYPDDSRFSDSRYRETPVVEVKRVEAGARLHEPDASNIHEPRQSYEMHAVPTGRSNIRCTASPVPSQPTKNHVGHFYPSHEFVTDIQSKGVSPGTPSPAHAFVPSNVAPGAAIDQFLTSPSLATPPGAAGPTPPPAHHHNQRENVQPMNTMLYRVPFMVQPQRSVYDPALQMPMDLKLGEAQSLEKVIEDKDIHGPLTSEFLSRQSSVIASHERSTQQLVSPHYDRGADSPKMVTGLHQRRYHNHFDYPPRAGTPNMEMDLPRSPAHHFGPGMPQGDVPLPNSQYHSSENLPYLLPQELQVMWEGILGLKNDQAIVKMLFISGSGEVARGALLTNFMRTIRISQRMRLEQSQLEGVARKMQMPAEHCVLMAVPYGRNHPELVQQHRSLENGFIKYLGDKKAAGIVNVSAPGSQQSAFVIHIFPPCDFVNEKLSQIAPNVAQSFGNTPRMMVVIATC